MMTLLIAVIGLLVGVCVTNSAKEGAGLLVLFLCFFALVGAAIGGVAGGLIGGEVGTWFVRAALFCLLFIAGVFFAETRRS